MLLRMVVAAVGRWGERRQRKAAIRELRALDNRALKDMGLTRGEIVAAVDGQVYRGEPAGRREPAPPSRPKPETAPAATIDPAALQGHLERARQQRAESIAGLCARGLGSVLRLLRRAAAALRRRKPTRCPSRRQLMPPQPAAGDHRDHPKENRHDRRSRHAA
jgi:uncharacterized protein YjiS (DUF1127 family)